MGIRVVIADDEEDIADATSTILSMKGFEVAYTLSALDVPQLVKSHHAQVLLHDAHMPNIDLPKSIRESRAAAPGKLVVLLFTASVDAESLSPKVGADGYIAKPLNVDQAIATIQRMVAAASRK